MNTAPYAQPRLDVTAALILQGDMVLITRRPAGARHGGRWEFPGGKREPGENLEACLRREIKEELDLEVRIDGHCLSLEHDYSDLALTLHAFFCRPVEEPPSFPDPVEFAWVRIGELTARDLLPPDMEIAEYLKKIRSRGDLK